MNEEEKMIKTEKSTQRIQQLLHLLAKQGQSFDTLIIVDKINQYYFTGTMQDALLLIQADGNYHYFVRKSYERARLESSLENIYAMNSYRDIKKIIPEDLGRVYLETSIMPLNMLNRLKKNFNFAKIKALEPYILALRAVKDEKEEALIRQAGKLQSQLMRSIIPSLLREDMTEADLLAELYAAMIKQGHHGVSRFGMFQVDMVAGQLGFGENSLYPTCFDGPGGMRGMSAAVPGIGSRERKLKLGDLVFIDIAFGVDGYHSDKTQVYSFGKKLSAEAIAIHRACIDVIKRAEELLLPGAVPEQIYQKTMDQLPPLLKDNFMGYGSGQVNFLGHGIGLQVDEAPIIANKFKDPLAEGMCLALEPKSGLKDVGMLGVEESYIIKDKEAECVSGGPSDIIVV